MQRTQKSPVEKKINIEHGSFGQRENKTQNEAAHAVKLQQQLDQAIQENQFNQITMLIEQGVKVSLPVFSTWLTLSSPIFLRENKACLQQAVCSLFQQINPTEDTRRLENEIENLLKNKYLRIEDFGKIIRKVLCNIEIDHSTAEDAELPLWNSLLIFALHNFSLRFVTYLLENEKFSEWKESKKIEFLGAVVWSQKNDMPKFLTYLLNQYEFSKDAINSALNHAVKSSRIDDAGHIKLLLSKGAKPFLGRYNTIFNILERNDREIFKNETFKLLLSHLLDIRDNEGKVVGQKKLSEQPWFPVMLRAILGISEERLAYLQAAGYCNKTEISQQIDLMFFYYYESYDISAWPEQIKKNVLRCLFQYGNPFNYQLIFPISWTRDKAGNQHEPYGYAKNLETCAKFLENEIASSQALSGMIVPVLRANIIRHQITLIGVYTAWANVYQTEHGKDSPRWELYQKALQATGQAKQLLEKTPRSEWQAAEYNAAHLLKKKAPYMRYWVIELEDALNEKDYKVGYSQAVFETVNILLIQLGWIDENGELTRAGKKWMGGYVYAVLNLQQKAFLQQCLIKIEQDTKIKRALQLTWSLAPSELLDEITSFLAETTPQLPKGSVQRTSEDSEEADEDEDEDDEDEQEHTEETKTASGLVKRIEPLQQNLQQERKVELLIRNIEQLQKQLQEQLQQLPEQFQQLKRRFQQEDEASRTFELAQIRRKNPQPFQQEHKAKTEVETSQSDRKIQTAESEIDQRPEEKEEKILSKDESLETANHYFITNKHQKAISLYIKLAETDIRAVLMLIFLYDDYFYDLILGYYDLIDSTKHAEYLEKAKRKWVNKEQENNDNSAFYTGICYFFGVGTVKIDIKKARKFFEKQYKKKNKTLSWLSALGIGMTCYHEMREFESKNRNIHNPSAFEATKNRLENSYFSHIKAVADTGFAMAQLIYGLYLPTHDILPIELTSEKTKIKIKLTQPKNPEHYFKAAANQGNACAQLELIERSKRNLIKELNHEELLPVYLGKHSSSHLMVGFLEFGMGFCYEHGFGGLTQDFKKAVGFYMKATTLGDADGAYALARCFQMGRGVPVDIQKAVTYARQAHSRLHPDALSLITELKASGGIVSTDLLNQEIPRQEINTKLSELYKEGLRYEDQGNTRKAWASYNSIIDIIETHSGIQANARALDDPYLSNAIFRCTQALEKDPDAPPEETEETIADNYRVLAKKPYEHPYAQYKYAECLRNGKGVGKSFELALEFYKKAADAGCTEAESFVAQYSETRESKRTDAIKYYKNLAAKGDVKAHFYLAKCYAQGLGEPKDITKAARFYQQVSDYHIEAGGTALILASSHIDEPELIAELLKEDKIDINHQDYIYGQTALMGASPKGHHRVVAALLKRNANINKADKDGKTALIHAIENGHTRCANALLSFAELDINACDNTGKTPLMYAAQLGQLEICRKLLDKEAHLDIKDKSGRNALAYATQRRHSRVINLLQAKNKSDSPAQKAPSLEELKELQEKEEAEELKRMEEKKEDIKKRLNQMWESCDGIITNYRKKLKKIEGAPELTNSIKKILPVLTKFCSDIDSFVQKLDSETVKDSHLTWQIYQSRFDTLLAESERINHAIDSYLQRQKASRSEAKALRNEIAVESDIPKEVKEPKQKKKTRQKYREPKEDQENKMNPPMKPPSQNLLAQGTQHVQAIPMVREKKLEEKIKTLQYIQFLKKIMLYLSAIQNKLMKKYLLEGVLYLIFILARNFTSYSSTSRNYNRHLRDHLIHNHAALQASTATDLRTACEILLTQFKEILKSNSPQELFSSDWLKGVSSLSKLLYGFMSSDPPAQGEELEKTRAQECDAVLAWATEELTKEQALTAEQKRELPSSSSQEDTRNSALNLAKEFALIARPLTLIKVNEGGRFFGELRQAGNEARHSKSAQELLDKIFPRLAPMEGVKNKGESQPHLSASAPSSRRNSVATTPFWKRRASASVPVSSGVAADSQIERRSSI